MKHFFYIIFLSHPFSLLKDVLNTNLVKKNLFSLMVLAIIPLFLYSQESIGKKITVLSPNTESYKVYGDIPVSLYTGVPQIKIPLYEIKTDYVNLDINLTYHSSGFKADNHPSWVGLGWNLNAGGVISRTIKYIPDENNSLAGRVDCYNPSCGIGFYYSHNVLNKLNNDYNRWIIGIENDGTIWLKLKDSIYGRIPDSNYLMLMTTEDIEFPLI